MGLAVSAPAATDRLNPRDFERLAAFVEEVSGIRMPPSKKTMMEGRLRRRAWALGLESLDDYCRGLFDEGWLDDEAVGLIDAVTTNKTEFFREEVHFQLFERLVLEAPEDRRGRPGFDRPLKVWSAACSTGAEPYTLAMVLDGIRQQRRGFDFTILGTDICTDVLAKARAGVFPADMARPVPDDMRRRYVLRSRDPRAGTVRLAPEIRQAVHFGRLNLMEPSYPVDRDMDAIFCRNVLIYFDKVRQAAVLERLCGHLRRGGHLFISHTESVAGMTLPLRPVAVSVFERL